jgi:hypothetical protein
MADPIIANPLGVDVAQGNVYYNDAQITRYAVDPYGAYSTITAVSSASAAVITTSAAHGLVTGQPVTIVFTSGVTTTLGQVINPQIQYVVTVLTSTTFSIAVNTTGNTYGGTFGNSYVIGGFVPGQLVWIPAPAFQSGTGTTVAGGSPAVPGLTWTSVQGTATYNYPIAQLAPTGASATQKALTVGVVLGGATPGSIAPPGTPVQVITSGLALVLSDIALTAGQTITAGGATNPGMPLSVAPASVVAGTGLGNIVFANPTTPTTAIRQYNVVLMKAS